MIATEDSTLITLSGFHPLVSFRKGGADVPNTGPVKMLLQKGESVVFAMYLNNEKPPQPPNGFMGALLKSTKPIAVNVGSWVGAPVFFEAHDIGIDQIAPFEKTGKEYILCKGNGNDVLEHPIVIAHLDDTKVWINGNTIPERVLKAGEFYVVPTQDYSPGDNMFIRTSKPAFVYQVIGGTTIGNDARRTAA
ncbi:MAG: IgGFc-binding protein [Alphaproteobacteria bacterium]